MKSKSFVVLAVLFLCACPASALIEFNDGQINNIDYVVEEHVYVDYQTPEMYTTVNVLPGGNIEYLYHLEAYEQGRINVQGGSIFHLYSYNSSRIDFSGGKSGWINCYDTSQVDMSGGSIHLDIRSYNYSRVNVTGGSIGFMFLIYDSSKVNISGGEILFLKSYDSSHLNVSGGNIETLDSYGSNPVNIFGGSIENLRSYDSSRVDIYSGSIDKYLYGLDSSLVNIFGGLIESDLALWDQSMIKIFGYDFAVDGQPVGYGELTSILGNNPWDDAFRHLTGTLLSGEFIDTGFLIGHDAKIILIPEPATILLLGLGGLFIKRRRS